MQQLDQKAIAKNRRQLVIMILVFVVPLIIAVVISKTQWRPGKTMNHGTLLPTPVELMQFKLTTDKGNEFTLKEIERHLSVIYFADKSCNKECEDVLFKVRQGRLAQGQNVKFMQYIYVLPVGVESAGLAELRKEHPDMIVLGGDNNELSKLEQAFTIEGKSPRGTPRIYIVDSYRQFIMYYEAEFNPKGMIKDTERLFKVLKF